MDLKGYKFISIRHRESPFKVDYTTSMLKFVSENDVGISAENFAQSCYEFEQLRENTMMGKSLKNYQAYYCQLLSVSNRFPLNNKSKYAVQYKWKWEDDISIPVLTYEVEYEIACVLFCCGSIQADEACTLVRLTDNDQKDCITKMQEAAGIFEKLYSIFDSNSKCSELNIVQLKSFEFSTVFLNAITKIMMAQSQFAILDKSIDKGKPEILSKIAYQISIWYSEASMNLLEVNVKKKSSGGIMEYLYMCSSVSMAIAYIFKGLEYQNQSKWGKRETCYFGALNSIREIKKTKFTLDSPFHFPSNFSTVVDLKDFFEPFKDRVTRYLNDAKTENSKIYHESVPKIEEIHMKGESYIVGKMFDTEDPSYGRKDLFKAMVLVKSHTISSIYSEMKLNLLKKYQEKVDTHNSALANFVSSYSKLNENMYNCTSLTLPESVISVYAHFSEFYKGNNNILTIYQMPRKLYDKSLIISTKYTAIINEINALKLCEDSTKGYIKKVHEYSASLERCNVKMDLLQSHIEKIKPTFDLLGKVKTLDELDNIISEGTKSIPDSDKELIRRLEEIMEKKNHMVIQRASFMEELKRNIQKDDIIQAISVSKSQNNELLQKQIKKHDVLLKYIDINLAAQKKIVYFIEERYAQFMDVYDRRNLVTKRRNCIIKDITNVFETIRDIETEYRSVLQMYVDLEKKVSHVLEYYTDLRMRPKPIVSQPFDDMRKVNPVLISAPGQFNYNQLPQTQQNYYRNYMPSNQQNTQLPTANYQYNQNYKVAPQNPNNQRQFMGNYQTIPDPQHNQVNIKNVKHEANQINPSVSQYNQYYQVQNQPTHSYETTLNRGMNQLNINQQPSKNYPPSSYQDNRYHQSKEAYSQNNQNMNVFMNAHGEIVSKQPRPNENYQNSPNQYSYNIPNQYQNKANIHTPIHLSKILTGSSIMDENSQIEYKDFQILQPSANRPTKPKMDPEQMNPILYHQKIQDSKESSDTEEIPKLTFNINRFYALAGVFEKSKRMLVCYDNTNYDNDWDKLYRQMFDEYGRIKKDPFVRQWRRCQFIDKNPSVRIPISVARVHHSKNHNLLFLPYDYTRVVINQTPDYINAYHVPDLSVYSPNFIFAQLPLNTTICDFFQMLADYKIENIAILCAHQDFYNDSRVWDKWFSDLDNICYGDWIVSIEPYQTVSTPDIYIRKLILTQKSNSVSMKVIISIFCQWRKSEEPIEKIHQLSFFTYNLQNLYISQHSLCNPIALVSLEGVGRCATFALSYSIINQVKYGGGLDDPVRLLKKLKKHHKYSVKFLSHFVFSIRFALSNVFNYVSNKQVYEGSSFFHHVQSRYAVNPDANDMQLIKELDGLDSSWLF
ncbi:ALG-2 interacting protein X [Intoshia linei]|uniref:ALG-2 interacting protein X n=1 Tax=Intoshia linei TaxID=1819745 RepID=A0A177AYS8_9BILA|nr:ALG-2 interacting protein X [Intoshia linei]